GARGEDGLAAAEIPHLDAHSVSVQLLDEHIELRASVANGVGRQLGNDELNVGHSGQPKELDTFSDESPSRPDGPAVAGKEFGANHGCAEGAPSVLQVRWRCERSNPDGQE